MSGRCQDFLEIMRAAYNCARYAKPAYDFFEFHYSVSILRELFTETVKPFWGSIMLRLIYKFYWIRFGCTQQFNSTGPQPLLMPLNSGKEVSILYWFKMDEQCGKFGNDFQLFFVVNSTSEWGFAISTSAVTGRSIHPIFCIKYK